MFFSFGSCCVSGDRVCKVDPCFFSLFLFVAKAPRCSLVVALVHIGQPREFFAFFSLFSVSDLNYSIK